jgi:hypothetical protein
LLQFVTQTCPEPLDATATAGIVSRAAGKTIRNNLFTP